MHSVERISVYAVSLSSNREPTPSNRSSPHPDPGLPGQLRQLQRRPPTTHRQRRSFHQRFDEIEAKIDRLLHAARAEKQRDRENMATTQEAIDELKAEVGPMSNAVTAVSTAVDKMLELIEAAGDDPEEIAEVTAAFRAERDKIVAAALKGTPAAPPVEPPAETQF